MRIFIGAPGKFMGDHRQIMGGSWAVSRIFQNYAQIVSNPYIITSAEVVPRNREGLLRTWPLLIVILSISSAHFLQRVRVFFRHFRSSSKTTPLSKSAHFWGSAAAWCAKNNHFQYKERVWERNLKVQRRSVKSTIPDRPQKCYQTTEPDPGNTLFCKILQTPKFCAVEETGEAEVPLPVKGPRKRNSPICGRRFTFFTKVAENHSKSLINP